MPHGPAPLRGGHVRLFAVMFLLAVGVWIAGCCGSHRSLEGSMREVGHKFDAALRAELRGAANDTVIPVLLDLSTVSDEHLGRMSVDGLAIQSTAGTVVSARGNRDAILRAAHHAFVNRIELSRIRPGSGI